MLAIYYGVLAYSKIRFWLYDRTALSSPYQLPDFVYQGLQPSLLDLLSFTNGLKWSQYGNHLQSGLVIESVTCGGLPPLNLLVGPVGLWSALWKGKRFG